MTESEHESTKAWRIQDATIRDTVAAIFSDEYRHGYHLAEIVRSQDGNWLCIWRRTTESYGSDFDWQAPSNDAPEEQSKND